MENNRLQLNDKIIIKDLSHSFIVPNSKTMMKILNSISFNVKEHEILCIVGHSGCGKSTLLRIISGLLKPDEGTVKIDGVPIEGISTNRILLFQDLYLFYWMTVLENVEFIFEARGFSKNDRNEKALELINLVGLKTFEKYYPHEISGGMQQRLALARSLAAEPSILLLDEPFSSLDVQTQSELEKEFLNLHETKKFTTIIVTHDIRQAIYLGDRVIVMSNRPANIKALFDIPFQRPRNLEIKHSEEFYYLEANLSETIKNI